jgi:hypothetical protein
VFYNLFDHLSLIDKADDFHLATTMAKAEVLRVIAANRSPDSYLAGATIVHRKPDSPRTSLDLDFFHELEDSIADAGEADAKALNEAGYDLQWLLRTPTFYRAILTASNGNALKIEWAQDNAFRFFPVQQDELCGYRLHDADAATNKVLALAGRNEIRDLIDVLYLDEHYLSLGALIWAACGKDPGYTPEFLLDQASRHTAYTQRELDHLLLQQPMDLTTMKQQWLEAAARADDLVTALPAGDLGCLYLSNLGEPVKPDPRNSDFGGLIRHHGTVRGAWPSVVAWKGHGITP